VQDRHNLYSLCSDQVIELGRDFGASKEMLAKLRMLGESLGAIERSPIGYQRQTRILEACQMIGGCHFWDY